MEKKIYKGVCWVPKRKCWRAQIRVRNKGIYLGSFSTQKEAAKEYDKACWEHNKNMDMLNFPPEDLLRQKILRDSEKDIKVVLPKGNRSLFK